MLEVLIMKDTRSLLAEYVLATSKGENVKLESFIADYLKEEDLQTLKEYSNKECISFTSGSSKKMIIDNIYNSCNRVLGYMILATRGYNGETHEEFYERMYVQQFM